MSDLNTYLKELLEEASAGLARVTQKRMFGSNGFFGDSKVYALTWDGRIVLKVRDAALNAELLAMTGAAPWSPMPQRESAMKHWVLVGEALHDDTDELRRYVKQAHAEALIAAKEPAAPKKKAAAKKKPVAKKAASTRSSPTKKRAVRR